MRIQFLNGENAGTRREIESDGIGIGRETDNGIQLLGGRVSRYHARLEHRQDGWYILDLGSTNGTKINGENLSGSAKLRNGDVVAVGEIMFRVEKVTAAVSGDSEKTEPEAPAFVFHPPEDHTRTAAAAPAPGPSPAPEPPRTPEPPPVPESDAPKEQAASGKERGADLARTIQDLDHLFKRESFTRAEETSTRAGSFSDSRKRIINLLYLALLISVACAALFLFVKLQSPEGGGADPAESRIHTSSIPNPFFVFYEKREVTKNNGVFSFRLLLENDHLNFSLDDLLSGRVYSPAITELVRPEAVEKLKKAIAETNFMTSEQQERLSDSAENNKSFARLVVGYDDKFNDITVQDIVLTSFTRVEAAIRDFLQEEYGLDPSMAESRDELIREARNTFDLAEKQYRSYKTQPENLWRSIENYKIAMRRYEVFANKPPEWAAARQHLADAEAALKKIREEGHDNVNLYYQQRDFRKAVQECSRIMEFFPPDSETYQNIRAMKLKLENLMSKDK